MPDERHFLLAWLVLSVDLKLSVTGRWPSQCQASHVWSMAPQWSCIFQSLCRVSKALGQKTWRLGWPGDDENDDPWLPGTTNFSRRKRRTRLERCKSGQKNLVFFSFCQGGLSTLISTFFSSLGGRIMSSEIDQSLSVMTLWGNGLHASAFSLHPVWKLLSLQEEEDLQAPRRTGSRLDASVQQKSTDEQKWTTKKFGRLDLSAFAKRFGGFSRLQSHDELGLWLHGESCEVIFFVEWQERWRHWNRR